MNLKKVIGSFMLNVWAATMRVVMAQYCVKYLTLKNRRNAVKYLPGMEKELKLIEKLGFSVDEVSARVWSYETKLALLTGRNPALNCALISDITTEKELNAVFERGVVKDVIAAMRVYTPSRMWLLKALNSVRFDISKWCNVAKAVPAAFESLEPWEILGVNENEPCYIGGNRWYLALELAEARPSWAPLFMSELRNIAPHHLGEKGEELMQKFFDIAFKEKSDISHLMPYLYVIFPELYLKVRENYSGYKNFAPFVEKMFPQVFKFLEPDETKTSFGQIKFLSSVEDKEEAYAWLFIVYNMLGNKAVYQLMLKHLTALKRCVNKELFNAMFDRMIARVHNADEARELYALCNKVDAEPYQRCDVCERIVDFAAVKENHVRLGFAFPFNGWEKKLAKRAVILMAQTKQLAGFADRLSELPYGLEQVAFEAMEIQSQMDALDGQNLRQMVTTTKLYPEVEKKFFCMSSNMHNMQMTLQKLKLEYISQHQPDDIVFRALVSDVRLLAYDLRKALLVAYLQKWGLQMWQYKLVMQSCFSEEAPLWKEYIKN